VSKEIAELKMMINNSNSKELFTAKNAEHNLMGGFINPVLNRSEQDMRSEYFDYVQLMTKRSRIAFSKFSRVYTEFRRTDVLIDGISFERSEIDTRIPERTLLMNSFYQGFYRSHQIVVYTLFKNSKSGSAMTESIENATFSEQKSVDQRQAEEKS